MPPLAGRTGTSAVRWTALVTFGAAVTLVAILLGPRRSSRARAEAPAPSAVPATLHALGDLAPGMTLGPYVVRGVSEPTSGAVLVRASSSAGDVTYEVRLLSDRPLPPARTGKYSIYYRGTDGGADILAGATALAAILEKAPDAPPLPGITLYPTVFTAL